MPWKVLKRNCKQADGTKGTYVIVKVKAKGKTEQSSCHTSKAKAQGGVRARYASEGKEMKITKKQLQQIIREERAKISEAAPSALGMQIFSIKDALFDIKLGVARYDEELANDLELQIDRLLRLGYKV